MRGYFGIGIYQPQCGDNIGTLWRSAYQLGASFIFTVGKGVARHPGDTVKAYRHIPMLIFPELADLRVDDAELVAIEQGGEDLFIFEHPVRAVYLLGNERTGLPKDILDRCCSVVSLPSVRSNSFNVSVAGSIVMMDRLRKKGN